MRACRLYKSPCLPEEEASFAIIHGIDDFVKDE